MTVFWLLCLGLAIGWALTAVSVRWEDRRASAAWDAQIRADRDDEAAA